MFLTILIIFIALIGLLALHEFGHLIIAKKFGVDVEEFGIGYPPRLFGKKIGKTLYSINLLPFGAFIKIKGEDKQIKDEKSFSEKAIWQRALILLGGVVSFWLVAFLIFSFTSAIWGLPTSVSDDFIGQTIVQIVQINKDSPAQASGLKIGDIIKGLKIQNQELEITKVGEVQQFTNFHRGEEIVLTIQRGKEVSEISLSPRVSPPEGQGAIGVALVRVSKIKSSWYKSFYTGAIVTYQKTVQIPVVLTGVLQKLFKGEKVEGVEFVGPIGVASLMGRALNVGLDNFLLFIGLIAIWLALFNLLPIPGLDGGKLLFLVIESVRKKPVSQKIEQSITVICFLCLIILMVFVTIKDILKLCQ